MLEKIKEIKAKYPIPFWITCLLILPVGIFLGMWFLLSRKAPTGRDLLDAAARAQGQADVHQQGADQAAAEAKPQEKELRKRKAELKELVKKVGKRAEKYKEAVKKTQDADSWDVLDKQAGVK